MLAEPGNEGRVVRELRLRRRRSRIPWVYLVYQSPCGSALTAKKRRYVERRVEIEAVLVC